MNTLIAASLFDNPWVLVVIVLAGALSQWLMKRRQRNQADNLSEGDEPLPTPGNPQERSLRELDLQEALRALLGGEPPPRAPQPQPIPPVMRDAQPAEVEAQFEREETWMDEPQERYEAAPPPAIPTAPPARSYPALTQARVARMETSERHAQAARRFEQLKEQGSHPATVLNTGRGRGSCDGTRSIGLLRHHRTARQAFVASLVFGPPKASET